MKLRIPTWARVASIGLVLLSLVPSAALQMLFWPLLAIPFQSRYAPPLVYRDKPWFLTPTGCNVTATIWALGLIALGVLVAWVKDRTKKPTGAPDPTR